MPVAKVNQAEHSRAGGGERTKAAFLRKAHFPSYNAPISRFFRSFLPLHPLLHRRKARPIFPDSPPQLVPRRSR